MQPLHRVWLVACAVLLLASCGSAIDVTKATQVTSVTTGWFDAGVENGMNKLIPTVSFRLKNVSGLAIKNVQLNAVFRRVGETEEWGAAYMQVLNNGLPSGATSGPLTLRSNLGYTSTEPRSTMLGHSQFKDAHVKVFAKQGSMEWQPLGEWDIQRALMVAAATQ